MVYEQQELELPLIAVDGDTPPLLARNWLEQVNLAQYLSCEQGWHSVWCSKSVQNGIRHGTGNHRRFQFGYKVARWGETNSLQSLSSSLCTTPKGGRRIIEVRSRKTWGWTGVTWLLRLSAYPRKLEVYSSVVISRCRSTRSLRQPLPAAGHGRYICNIMKWKCVQQDWFVKCLSANRTEHE